MGDTRHAERYAAALLASIVPKAEAAGKAVMVEPKSLNPGRFKWDSDYLDR
jgi:hypothetical protein